MNAKKLIGIFGANVASGLQANLYTQLHRQAVKEGYRLLVFSGTYDKVSFRNTTGATRSLYAMAENIDLSAIFIHAQSLENRELVRQLIDLGQRKNTPVFVYDCEALGITASPGVHPINLDYKQGFAESVRHLIEVHHCKRIFMLGGLRDNKYSDDRIEMYRREMDSHGLPYSEEQIGYGDFWETPALEAVDRFLDADLPFPDAICCANDSMAIAAIKALTRRGYKVPEDLLVTGFDGIEDGKYHFPNISTCEPRLEAVADYLFAYLKGEDKREEFLVPLIFLPKESCSCSRGVTLEDKREMTKLVDNLRLGSWQRRMLTTMQFSLIDSNDLSDMVKPICDILDLQPGYTHLFCVRDDIESRTDYTEELDRMRVMVNRGLLDPGDYPAFETTEILPDFEQVLEKSEPDDIYFLRLIHNEDNKYGYLVVRTKEYSSNNLLLIDQFTENITIVMESILRNKRLYLANQKLSEMYDRMSEIYIRDTMTGLYNRHGYYGNLEEYISRADLKDGYVHIISIDMDGMKFINDNFGHLEGDQAIKAVGQAINECFSQPCVSARFGGDEFMVALFTDTGDQPTTEKISAKMNNYLRTMPMLADKEYSVVVSIGSVSIKLSEVKDFKVVEKMADDSMYQEKRRHKQKKASRDQ